MTGIAGCSEKGQQLTQQILREFFVDHVTSAACGLRYLRISHLKTFFMELFKRKWVQKHATFHWMN